MSKGYMYILECSDGSYYTGSTNNIDRRLNEHNKIGSKTKGAKYTSARQPVRLVYFEEYERIDEAFYREKQVQNWSHKKKLALIEGQNELLPTMAKKVFAKNGLLDTFLALRQAQSSEHSETGSKGKNDCKEKLTSDCG